MQISIHALREEGDTVAFGFSHIRVLISIHALREEGDLVVLFLTRMPPKFQSTPSARRATRHPRRALHFAHISIHALREEGDPAQLRTGHVLHGISIHALREEGDD